MSSNLAPVLDITLEKVQAAVSMGDLIPDVQEAFTFLWRFEFRQIKCMLTTNHNPTVEFTIPQLQNTRWTLTAYLELEEEEGNYSLGFSLQRINDKGPDSIDVVISWNTLPVLNYHLDKYQFSQFTRHLLSKVVFYGPCKPIATSLTIVLNFRYNRREPTTISEDYVPLCWDILNVLRSVERNGAPLEYRMNYPHHRFVQSKSYFEPAQISCPVKSSLINGDLRMQIYPTVLSDCISIVYASVINTGIDTLSFEILFINYSATSVRMTCEVGIRYYEESHLIALEDHIFPANLTVDNWRLNNEINCSNIVKIFSKHPINGWQWTFNFTFSRSGYPCESAEKWVEFKINPYYIRNSPFYKFMNSSERPGSCDLTVKVKDTKFKAHKIILSHFSGWFKVEISRNANEGFLSIENIEEDVFEEILYFFYSGSFIKREFKTMKEVFTASVRFGIDTLRNETRNCLISQLTQQNALELQQLSSITNDDQLKEAVERSLSSNR